MKGETNRVNKLIIVVLKIQYTFSQKDEEEKQEFQTLRQKQTNKQTDLTLTGQDKKMQKQNIHLMFVLQRCQKGKWEFF